MDKYDSLVIEANNVLHMLNLDRSDIAALPNGSVISCNIATPRACAGLIKKLMQELHNALQSHKHLGTFCVQCGRNLKDCGCVITTQKSDDGNPCPIHGPKFVTMSCADCRRAVADHSTKHPSKD